MLCGNILHVLKVNCHKFIGKHLQILKQFNSNSQTGLLPRLWKMAISVFLLDSNVKKEKKKV